MSCLLCMPLVGHPFPVEMSRKRFASKNSDDGFDQFLKESISSADDSVDTSKINHFLEGKGKNKDKPWWSKDDDDSEILGTGNRKSFLKKKSVENKTGNNEEFLMSNGHDVRLSEDTSLDTTSLLSRSKPKLTNDIPALSLGDTTDTTDHKITLGGATHKPGFDTLDELDEKEKFFREIEKESDSTVDYSRLNREIDKDGTLPLGTLGDTNKQSGGEKHLLDNVALLDSLESTYGTKPADSREGNDGAMSVIPETGREDQTETARTLLSGRPNHESGIQQEAVREEEEYDENDGPHTDTQTDRKWTDTATRGITLKSGMGFGDTSNDLEAYHRALEAHAGLGTMDDALTLKDSSTIAGVKESIPRAGGTGNTSEGEVAGSTQRQAGTSNSFGHRPIVPPRTPHSKHNNADERTVDDIIREVEELKTERRPSVHFEDERGFALSPVHSSQADNHGIDLSPIEKVRTSHSMGFDTPDRNRSKVQESTPITDERGRGKKKSSKKDKFNHVTSSGYGVSHGSPSVLKTNQQETNSKSVHRIQSPKTNKRGNQRSTSRSPHRIQKKGTKVWSPADLHGNKQKAASSVELQASVEAFANYIQSQVSEQKHMKQWSHEEPTLSTSQKFSVLDREKAMVKEVNEWQEQWKEERRQHAKTKVELEHLQKLYNNKIEQVNVKHAEEIMKMKQENFILAAKIHGEGDNAESSKKLKKLLEDQEISRDEQIKLMAREVEEQEKLLAGYQTENERLYQEIKALQKSCKSTENAMFQENQKLKSEISSLKEQLSLKDVQLKNKGLITSPSVQRELAGGNIGAAQLGAHRIAQLEEKLKLTQTNEETFKLEVENLKAENNEFESKVNDLLQQLHNLQAKGLDTKAQCEKISQLEKEIERLNRKVKWYAENQQLLDKDVEVLKHKDDTIRRLEIKVQELSSESGRKAHEMRQKAKERSADAKRIQDLERQVKEMEAIVRKRHPNSLPVLMWAASTVPDAPREGEARSVAFLEQRIQKLEQERDEKEDQEQRSIRVLEQKYTAMKLQYEGRIEELETKLNGQNIAYPHTHAGALQKELDSVKDRSKKRIGELEIEVEKLKKEVTLLKTKEHNAAKSERRSKEDHELELESRVKALQLEISNKERENNQLKVQLSHLQKEKQTAEINASRQSGKLAKVANEKLEGKSKRLKNAATRVITPAMLQDTNPIENAELPPYSADTPVNDRHYEPGSFTGQHVEEVMRDRDMLRRKVEELALEKDQQRVNLQKLTAEAESRERRIREEAEDRITELQTAHRRELQQVMSSQAIKNATSKTAELESKACTQEAVIQHLKQQLTQVAIDTEKMSTLKVREATLETQVRQLLDELQEARKFHTPEMRHFEALNEKIRQMETRHQQREHELQQVIRSNSAAAHADLSHQVAHWQAVVESKNREIDKFRNELDSILEVLRELQRQGVLLPGKTYR